MAVNLAPSLVNGVNVENLGKTLNAVKENPRLGGYTFYGETTWKGGALSETQVKRYVHSEEGSARKETSFTLPVDEPVGLLGGNSAANPVEHILAGLASCLVIGISYNAAARGIELEDLQVHLEGDINLEGFLGLNEKVRPGYQSIQLNYLIKSKTPKEEIQSLIDHVEKTSPVLDIVGNPVPLKRNLDYSRE